MRRRVPVACAKQDRDRWLAVTTLKTDARKWEPTLFFLSAKFAKYFQPRRSHLIALGEFIEIIYPNTAINVVFHESFLSWLVSIIGHACDAIDTNTKRDAVVPSGVLSHHRAHR